jgi:hypothetical protein
MTVIPAPEAPTHELDGTRFTSLATPSRGSRDTAIWRERACAGDAIVVPIDVDFSLSNAGREPLRMVCCLPVGGQVAMAGDASFTPPWAE